MDEHQQSLSKNIVVSIVIAAILVDGLQAILTPLWIGIVLNPIIGLGAAVYFNRWFSRYGIQLLSKDNAGLFYGTVAAELIPFFDALPVWTTSVAITIVRNYYKKS